MDTIECMRSRRSVREFRPDDVPEAVITEILEAAINAPSAGNVQDWEFVVVRDMVKRRQLAAAAWGQDFIAAAPVIIVVCSDLRAISGAYGERGSSLYSIQNAAAATENILLAACAKGLGTCWIGAFDEEMVRNVLGMPLKVRPLAIVPVGYPAKPGRKPERRKLEKVVHRDGY